MGNRALETPGCLVGKQESTHDFPSSFKFNPCLVPQFAFILSLQMPVCERQMCSGSCEMKSIIFHLLCDSYHLCFIFIGAPNAKMQMSILQWFFFFFWPVAVHQTITKYNRALWPGCDCSSYDKMVRNQCYTSNSYRLTPGMNAVLNRNRRTKDAIMVLLYKNSHEEVERTSEEVNPSRWCLTFNLSA